MYKKFLKSKRNPTDFDNDEELSVNLQGLLPIAVRNATQLILEAKGYPYLVGGAVIDLFCESKVKDWDIEVFGLSYQQLSDALEPLGSPDLIGNKFGILKLKTNDIDMEFSIPRKENRVGLKHQDFDIELIPGLSIEEAARRRDFTVNAIYLSLLDGRVFDPYDGLSDLKHGVLQHVDHVTFIEDGLRAFRGIQIIGRKLEVSTIGLQNLVKDMIRAGDLDNVPEESIFGEFNKLFMKADRFKPSAIYMEKTGILEYFVQLKVMQDTPQSEKWHPEGDVWEHTKLVMEQAFKYRDELPEEWRQAFMWGMFLHDIGKPSTVNPETLSCYGHDKAGGKLARAFMEYLNAPKKLTDMTVQIVVGHMRPRQLVQQKCKMGSWRKLQNICPLNILAYVSMCDSDGRSFPPEGKDGEFKHIMKAWDDLGSPKDIIDSILMGRHLIERGHSPGREFGAILGLAYKYQIKTGEKDIDRLYKAGLHSAKSR